MGSRDDGGWRRHLVHREAFKKRQEEMKARGWKRALDKQLQVEAVRCVWV